MGKIALLFSGQGAGAPGMGRDLAQASPACRDIFMCGSDLLALCVEADAPKLGETRYAQPAIFATSLAGFRYYTERESGVFDGVAGHSLGEYAAMVAAGILTLEDGFRVIRARAEAMDDCARAQSGAMCAVLGKSPAEVEALCERVSGYVVPVNYNSPAQTVIAGEVAAVEQVMALCASEKAKTARLNVSAAFHTAMMQPAADAFLQAIAGISFSPPACEMYSNITGGLLDVAQLPAYLARHMVSPVRFADELSAMHAAGYDRFVEMGPGKVLTGLVKKTLPAVEATVLAV